MLQKQAEKNYLCSLTDKRKTMKHTNPQVEQMTSFIVMDVLERANELQKQGVDVIHLEVGEPDFDVPACVAEAANSDSEVILSNPGYACYRNFVLAAQAKPVLVPLSEENGLQYDIEAIRKCVTPHTAGIFINSPMNPTGMLLDESFLKSVASLGVPIISDLYTKDVRIVFWNIRIRLLS